jgi:hypothetical protein
MKTAAGQATAGREPGQRGQVLVGRQWLAAHLGDPRVRVVEVDVSARA